MLRGKVVVESGVSLIQCTFLKKHLLSPGKHKERQCLLSVSSLFQPELNSRIFVPVAVLLSDSFSTFLQTPPNPCERNLSQSLASALSGKLPLLGNESPWHCYISLQMK